MKYLISGICIALLSLLLFKTIDPPSLPIFSPSPTPVIKNPKLIFAGDMMLDRHIRQKAEQFGYDFLLDPLTTLFNQTDLVIVNLEGPITTNRSRSVNSIIGSPNNYTFTFDPAILPTLQKNQIRLVNLGNNHILNFGEVGLQTTIEYLDSSGIEYFGNTGHSGTRYKIITLHQKRLAFINYNQFVNNGKQACLEDIELVKNISDLIILYAHWDNEYITLSSPQIQALAHEFIDAGVDLIIGSHPHVVQETEIYQGKTIYYSLGNFVFDQYFSEETQHGLLVEVTIDSFNQFHFIDRPILLDRNGQTRLLEG